MNGNTLVQWLQAPILDDQPNNAYPRGDLHVHLKQMSVKEIELLQIVNFIVQ